MPAFSFDLKGSDSCCTPRTGAVQVYSLCVFVCSNKITACVFLTQSEARVIGRSAHLGILDEEISENQVSCFCVCFLTVIFKSRRVVVLLSLSLTLSTFKICAQLECKLTFSPVIAVELKVRVIRC